MNPIRPLALLPFLLLASAGGSIPPDQDPMDGRSPATREATPMRPALPRPAAPIATRPRWPADWPSLDPLQAEGANGIQSMSVGDLDIYVPAANLPPGFDPDYEDDGGSDDGEVDDELDRLGGMIRDSYKGDDEDGTDPFGDHEPADGEEAEVEPGSSDALPEGAGYQMVGPDGRPLQSLLLGQPFGLALDVTEEEASIPGRAGGRRELDWIEVRVRSAEGDDQRVRLWRQDEPNPDGTIRFATREPVIVAGNWGNMDHDGTVDVGLDLDDTQGAAIVRFVMPGVVGGTTAVVVHGDPIQRGIAEVRDALGFVDEYQTAELTTAEKLLQDPRVQADEKLRGEVEYWISRIKSRQAAAAQARRQLDHELPIYQLRLSKRILDMLVIPGPDGLEINDRPITAVDLDDALFYERKRLDERFGVGSPVIVPGAVMDVVGGYTLGSYSMFAHVTMGAQVWQLATGTNEFGEDASRLGALKDIGRNVLIMKLPGAVTNYLAEGNLVPSVTIRMPTLGRGGRSGAPPVQPRTQSPQPQAIVAPDGRILGRLSIDTAGGRLPYRGAGLTDDAIRSWRAQSNPATPSSTKIFNEQIAEMDEAVTLARRSGVSSTRIDEILQDARQQGIDDAAPFVVRRLEIEIAQRDGKILAGTDDVADLAGLASARQIAEMQVVDRGVLESVIAKSLKEAAGEPQVWTADEIAYGRAIRSRLEGGEDLSTWKGPEFVDEGFQATYEGMQPIFGQGELGAIRAAFDGRPLRIGGLSDRPATRGPLPSMDGVPGVSRPLSTVDEYRALVDRQSAGEVLDLSGIARPGVARTNADRIMVAQGAGRYEAARPDDFLDLFIPADAPLPPGVQVRVLETNVPTELVRQANLLSSRGSAGTNPPGVELAVRGVFSWNRVQVRARDVQAPTSRTNALIEAEFTRLSSAGVDVDALSTAISSLSPAERLAVLQNPALREAALAGRVRRPILENPTIVDPVADPAAVAGPSGRGASAEPVEVLIRSLGGSTGAVLEAYIVNHGDTPIRFQADGVVLEPVDRIDESSRSRIDEIVEAASSGKPLSPQEQRGKGTGPPPLPMEWPGANVVRVVLDAYCLEFDGGVPIVETVFRIAGTEAQTGGAAARAILAAGRALRDHDRLHPDTGPESYYHSIRQWALWVHEKGLDRAGFESAFVEHARKNFEAAGRDWSDEAESRVRELIPNRWEDLTAILEAAGTWNPE